MEAPRSSAGNGAAVNEIGIEAEIQARGRRFLETVQPRRLIALSPDWWQERVMGWAMADPDFRVQLLRFVDVLPSLRTPAAVASHMRQYFGNDRHSVVRLGSALAGRPSLRPVVSRAARAGVFAMAERFIGAPTVPDALPVLQRLAASGTAYTVDLLGEATLSDSDADAYRDRYLELVRGVASIHHPASADGQGNISVKLSSLAAHFEPAAPAASSLVVRGRLEPVLDEAMNAGLFVNIDLEQHRLRDLTYGIVNDLANTPRYSSWGHLGGVVRHGTFGQRHRLGLLQPVHSVLPA